MSKILITGVAGLLGSHFSRHLLSYGHNVIGIDNLFGGYEDFIHEDIDFHKIDLSNSKKVNLIFEQTKPDYVYHFAAYAAVGLSPFIRNFNYTNNVISSVNIINSCIINDVKKIIFTSSMDVYGNNKTPYTEDQIPLPEDPYGIAKYTIEQDLKSAQKDFNLQYSIIRPHNIIGIYQNIWDRYRNVIGIWIRQILNGESISVYGDGTQRRAFSDVEYYMNPFIHLMKEHNGEIFNIGADQDIQIIEAAKLMQKMVRNYGYNPSIKHLEPRNEVHTMYCDHTKAKEKLNFIDATDLEKVMYYMFKWALNQPKRKIKTIPYEIKKGIYSYWKK